MHPPPTSEFQKVKSYLLRLSNAKAGVTTDIDDVEQGRPTLKRRQPDGDSSPTGDSSSDPDKKDGPPQLKKRGEPQPSPSPEN